MALLNKFWDDVVAGPHPDQGLNRLRTNPNSTPSPQNNVNEAPQVSRSIAVAKPPSVGTSSLERDGWGPSTPTASSPPMSPTLESPDVRPKDNVWRSVFHPGSNTHMKKLGSQKFDKAETNTPTVYDWLYSKDSKSTWR